MLRLRGFLFVVKCFSLSVSSMDLDFLLMAHLQVIHVCYLLLFALISQDITKLWTGRVKCHKHDTQCQVRQSDGVVIGNSCKYLARSNPNRWLLHGNVFSSTTSPGKTADTFPGFHQAIGFTCGRFSDLVHLRKFRPSA